MKILRKYEWNDHLYCVIQNDDGTRLEIKGKTSMTEEEALAKVEEINAYRIAEAKVAEEASKPVVQKVIANFSDKEIIDEVKLRSLTVEDLGLSVEVK